MTNPTETDGATPGERPSGGANKALAWWFGDVDTLPLDAFRVVFGVMLAWHFLDYVPDAGLLFADWGILPRSFAFGGGLRESRLSLLDAVGTTWMATAFLVASIGAAVMLAAGYRTRLASVLCFLAVLSVHERNPLVLDGSDTVFRVVAFWLMFAPIGRSLSLDGAIARARGLAIARTGPAFTLRLLQLQVTAIYALNFWNKAQGSRWADGSALHFALHLEDFLVRDLGTYVADWEWFTVIGTYGALVFEGLFLPLVFFPLFQPYLRAVGLAMGAAFHGSIALLMKVGWFSYVMPATYLLFFEPAWVEWVAARLSAVLGPRVRRAGDRMVRALAALPASRPPTSDRANGPAMMLGRAALAVLFALSLWYATPKPVGPALPYHAAYVVELCGLHQSWDMFAPQPLDHEGRLEIVGKLENGVEIDLLRAGYGQGGFRPTRPYYDGWYYSRWFKVAERMASPDWVDYRLEYARSICRAYNSDLALGTPRLKTFEIRWVRRRIVYPEEQVPEWGATLIWEHRCYDDPVPEPSQSPAAPGA